MKPYLLLYDYTRMYVLCTYHTHTRLGCTHTHTHISISMHRRTRFTQLSSAFCLLYTMSSTHTHTHRTCTRPTDIIYAEDIEEKKYILHKQNPQKTVFSFSCDQSQTPSFFALLLPFLLLLPLLYSPSPPSLLYRIAGFVVVIIGVRHLSHTTAK